MINVGNQEVRHIYLDVPHSVSPKPSWYGERYERDTLVIDTVGLNDRTTIDNFQTPHSEQLHVAERWKMTDGGKTLEVYVQIEDPQAFYEPWRAIQRYRHVEMPYIEKICMENNTHFDLSHSEFRIQIGPYF
jgi:hypothetical protein